MTKCAKGIQNAHFCYRPKANALPCPRVKARGTGDTTTLHSLTPAPTFEGRVSTHHLHSTPARPADPNPIHTLLGAAVKVHSGPNGPPVKKTREHSAPKQLWPNRGRHNAFPLPGLGGKGGSRCVHRADVVEVELPSPVLAEAQRFDL